MFSVFFLFFLCASRPHAAYYLSRSDPGRVVDEKKKRVSRCDVIGERFFYNGPEMSRSNKASGYIVGDVPELLLARNC